MNKTKFSRWKKNLSFATKNSAIDSMSYCSVLTSAVHGGVCAGNGPPLQGRGVVGGGEGDSSQGNI